MSTVQITGASPFYDVAKRLQKDAMAKEINAQRDPWAIKPLHRKRFSQCYTEHNGNLYLWYNDMHGSTHCVHREAN